MIKFTKIISAFALGIALLFTGCSNLVEENTEQSSEYGTLIYGEDIRAINVDSVKTAKVFVTGNGITSPLTSEATKVEKGRGSVTIEKIPVGKNRIVTVRGYSDPNATAEVVDAVLRAVIDINPGVNTLPLIDWDVSRKGYVYNALFENGVNISTLSSEEMAAVDAATPSCDATNINLPLFVEDFKKGYDKLQASSAYILSVEKTLKRLTVEKAASSTESAPAFTATAYYSDGTNEDVTSSATWNSTETAVATVSGGKVILVAAGKTVISASHTFGGVTKTGAKQTVTVTSQGAGVVVYILSAYDEAAGGANIYGWKNSDKPYGDWPGTKMTKTDDGNAYYCIVNDTSEVDGFIINSVSDKKQTPDLTMPETDGHWLYYYDASSSKWTKKEYEGTRVSLPGGSLSAAINSEAVTDPVPPTVTITPAGGNISLSGSIKVTFTDGNDTISSASVEINGISYDMGTKAGTFTKSVKDLGITTGGTPITVSATVTNGEGTATKSATLTTADIPTVPDTFTWDNVNCYFVLTDRFKNGDTKNDASYGRVKTPDGVGSFHGGDIVGLTEKLDYLNDLGVNAVWISAPYEQMHGWTSGKNEGFAHYAFHGYYTLDWTFMDQSMGTIDEFRTFVNEAHKRGIRVVMDVVLNHTGYDNWQDMIDYGFGGFKDSYSKYNHTAFATNGKWSKGDGSTWGTNWDTESDWLKWWAFWVRGFADKTSWGHDNGTGYWTPAASVNSDPLHGSLSGLPDVVTEKTATVNLPTFLKTKWNGGSNSVTGNTNAGELNNTSSCAYGNTTGHSYKDYQLPSVSNVDWYNKSGDWRTDGKGAQTDYQIIWLSGWVREFGVDGFRCDTAKHVDMYRWGQLKDACESALAKWRADSTKEDTAGAKEWKDNFWMTGEAWGHGNGTSDDYYSTGKFDSMINFSFQGNSNTNGSTSCGTIPTTSHWSSYNGIGASTTDTDSNGNCNSTLSYLSSHDTGLLRHGDSKEVGTMFILLPAGIQIYYGDESWRPYAYTGYGDSDMMTRGDMNWDENASVVAHWGKLGKFRKFNPAVGAGKQTISGSTYIRNFTKTKASGIESNTVAISISSASLSGLTYSNGTTVYNWYDGKSATVQDGSVTFSGSSASTSAPVLCSDRNPADYGVKF